jgi:hypothetical protein
MANQQAVPEQLVLRLDGRSLGGLAKLHRTAGTLQVFVPYTCPELTKAALSRAAVLTQNLCAHITLFAVHLVPYPLPFDRPDVPAAFLERTLAAVAQAAGTQTDIRIGFARDAELGLEQILPHRALIVMATRKRWWPTAEAKLARILARAGHSVALVGV